MEHHKKSIIDSILKSGDIAAIADIGSRASELCLRQSQEEFSLTATHASERQL
jgi:hypothetical protein